MTSTSPFPPSTSTAGTGHITTTLLPNGHSHLSQLTYQYPLKLISPPRNHQSNLSTLVFLLSYGGGLVAGDTVHLTIHIEPGARLSIVTQGHTKVFSPSPELSPAPTTRQTLKVTIDNGAALCLLPDPVQPFAASIYEQIQRFHLRGDTASLCLLDWVTQGRGARGENWDLESWIGRNEVWWAAGAAAADHPDDSQKKERLLVRDSVKLHRHSPINPTSHELKEAMHGLGIVGTLILRGPLLHDLGAFFLDEFAALPRIGARDWRGDGDGDGDAAGGNGEKDAHEAWREARLRLETAEKVLWSAARVRSCVVVKFGAASVEGGRLWIGDMLMRQGSVARTFGDQALLCVR